METDSNRDALKKEALTWLARVGLASLMTRNGISQITLTNDDIAELSDRELTMFFDEDSLVFTLLNATSEAEERDSKTA